MWHSVSGTKPEFCQLFNFLTVECGLSWCGSRVLSNVHVVACGNANCTESDTVECGLSWCGSRVLSNVQVVACGNANCTESDTVECGLSWCGSRVLSNVQVVLSVGMQTALSPMRSLEFFQLSVSFAKETRTLLGVTAQFCSAC